MPANFVPRTREQIAFEARVAQCNLLREVFGNSFQPLVVDPAWLVADHQVVVRLAEYIYETRRWDRLPLLAEALEDAGCDDAELLRHCRETHEHVRGCWTLDGILGYE